MNTNLNLARKWRPKTFDEIVGQEISIKILQNGLYLKKLFPVYLFAGQRGCGKTSTARIFAAAINCKNLKTFQENPEQKIPCLECDSCKAMQRNNHPDFIEIDAASHTGVDNVRQILEACAYMPLSGSKKIYLIDEAHMLSKAAFNAFLKVLEEPPNTVLFILATTEIHKFPETVLSRCFQAIFSPVDNQNLKNHIEALCTAENIEIDDDAIEIILQETEGSVRDAINLLERVRFSDKKINKDSILKVLGKISEKDFHAIFEYLIDQEPAKLLTQLESISFQNINPQIFWNTLVQTCRLLMWTKYGVKTKNGNTEQVKNLANKCSTNRLLAIFQLLWDQEPIFLQTTQKHIFIESVLIQICEQENIEDIKKLINTCNSGNLNSPAFSNPANKIENANTTNNTNSKEWGSFLQEIQSKTTDPLLLSILQQARFIKADLENKVVCISLNNNSSFFKDKIEESKQTWLNALQKQFHSCSGLSFVESQAQAPKLQPKNNNFSYQNSNNATKAQFSPHKNLINPNNRIDITDKEKWPKSNLIIKHFPGKIKSA